MSLYRPRMLLELVVPVTGDRRSREQEESDDSATTMILQVRRAHLEYNDHNHSDQLKVTVDWKEAGCDPRLLRNAVGALYLADADDRGRWTPSKENLQFIGIMTHPQRSGRCGEPMTVELDFLDYTTLFLEAKPFGTKGVPDFSMNLVDAWFLICEQTPGAKALGPQLVKSPDIDYWPTLGKAVSKRFAGLLTRDEQTGVMRPNGTPKVPVKPGTDAWAVWQQCVGMMGLISYFDRDQCVVTTATNYYTAKDPPRMVWGKNILAVTEGRNTFVGKGIGMTSHDPLTGRAIEAVWPPIGDPKIKRKHVAAKKVRDVSQVRQAEEREWFAMHSVTDPAALLDVAKRVYEERSRQEIEGSIVIADMLTETVSGETFNLLKLRTGNDIKIEIDGKDNELLAAIPAASVRYAYLVDHGYSDQMARIIAEASSDIALLDSTFFTRKVTTTIDPGSEQFEISVQFANRILVSGATDQGAAQGR